MLDPNLEEEQRTFEMTRAIATAALRLLQQIAPDMRTPLPLFSKSVENTRATLQASGDLAPVLERPMSDPLWLWWDLRRLMKHH